VENVLALTPVLAEWKRRNGSLAKVETMFPELLLGNSCVSEASKLIASEDNFIDMGLVRWPLLVKSVVATYAESVFGDTDMGCWGTVMGSFDAEIEEAYGKKPKGKVAAVSRDGVEIKHWSSVEDVLRSTGYEILDVGAISSLRTRRAMISVSDLFVGVDGPSSSLAYTTNVPAVVIHTWRSPCYFIPFRRGIPFESLTISEKDCPQARICLANNGFTEFGKVYGHRCTMEPMFKCEGLEFGIMVRKALENILLEA
jgi:hypothetical protein